MPGARHQYCAADERIVRPAVHYLSAVDEARCPPEKPANANTMKKISANKTTGNFQVDSGPKDDVRTVSFLL